MVWNKIELEGDSQSLVLILNKRNLNQPWEIALLTNECLRLFEGFDSYKIIYTHGSNNSCTHELAKQALYCNHSILRPPCWFEL